MKIGKVSALGAIYLAAFATNLSAEEPDQGDISSCFVKVEGTYQVPGAKNTVRKTGTMLRLALDPVTNKNIKWDTEACQGARSAGRANLEYKRNQVKENKNRLETYFASLKLQHGELEKSVEELVQFRSADGSNHARLVREQSAISSNYDTLIKDYRSGPSASYSTSLRQYTDQRNRFNLEATAFETAQAGFVERVSSVEAKTKDYGKRLAEYCKGLAGKKPEVCQSLS